MANKPLLSEDVCWHCHQLHGSQAKATRLERSYRLTSEALDQSQEDLHKTLTENERLRGVERDLLWFIKHVRDNSHDYLLAREAEELVIRYGDPDASPPRAT